MTTPILTAERLRELLHYDPDTGIFTRLKISNNRHPTRLGRQAGWLSKEGYRVLRVDRAVFKAHRLAWLYVYGVWPPDQIDHINCVRSDNRIKNLRVVCNKQNSHNTRSASAQNKSGLLGVHLHTKNKTWISQIMLDGKKYYLGSFPTPEEAHAAYVEAKRRLHPAGTL